MHISVYIYGASLRTNPKLWKVAAQSEWMGPNIIFIWEKSIHSIQIIRDR